VSDPDETVGDGNGRTTGDRTGSAPEDDPTGPPPGATGTGDDRWRAGGRGPVITTGDTTVIARTSVRVVVPIVILTSVSLLFQGHILPGGGFIGGVLTATAFALVYIVYGLDYVREGLLKVGVERTADAGPEARSGAYRTTFAAGLGLAAGSGLVPLGLALVPAGTGIPVLGGVLDGSSLPFLTQAVFFLEHLPLYGEFEVASAFAFDLGVYLVVVGGLLTILREVGEE